MLADVFTAAETVGAVAAEVGCDEALAAELVTVSGWMNPPSETADDSARRDCQCRQPNIVATDSVTSNPINRSFFKVISTLAACPANNNRSILVFS